MVVIVKSGFDWIPQSVASETKVTIDSDTVTDDVLHMDCSQIATDGIGEFTLLLDNNDAAYKGTYTGGETVTIYLDRTDASNVIFKGVVETVKKKFGEAGDQLELKGGYISSELLSITVTANFTNTAVSTILTSLISTYLTGYTTTNLTASTTTTTIAWENAPFWDCVRDLCLIPEPTKFDCYVDEDKDFHFFERESITNENEAIVDTDNMLSEDGLSDSIQEVKNRIKIRGKETEGMPLIYTKDDSTSQTDYNLRVKNINDENITTIAQAEDRATAELAYLKDSVVEGKATAFALITLKPGELVYVSIKTQDILAKYRCAKIVHTFGHLEPYAFTEVYLDNEPKALQHLFKDRIEKERQLQKGGNPNDMGYSFVSPLDSSSEVSSTSNITIAGGKAKLSSGASTGNFITALHEAPASITHVELRANRSDDVVIGTTATFEVSLDNGISWTTVSDVGFNGNSGTKVPITLEKQGKKVKVKVTLNTSGTYTDPEIEALSVLYNTS